LDAAEAACLNTIGHRNGSPWMFDLTVDGGGRRAAERQLRERR
jgi:hypothetical protein